MQTFLIVLGLFSATGIIKFFTQSILYTHILINYVLIKKKLNFIILIAVLLMYINFYNLNQSFVYISTMLFIVMRFIFSRYENSFYRVNIIYSKNSRLIIYLIIVIINLAIFIYIERNNLFYVYNIAATNIFINIILYFLIQLTYQKHKQIF